METLRSVSDVQEALAKYQEAHLLVGFGSSAQYEDFQQVVDTLAPLLQGIHQRTTGKWLLLYGGDAARPDAPDVGLLACRLAEHWGCAVLAPRLIEGEDAAAAAAMEAAVAAGVVPKADSLTTSADGGSPPAAPQPLGMAEAAALEQEAEEHCDVGRSSALAVSALAPSGPLAAWLRLHPHVTHVYLMPAQYEADLQAQAAASVPPAADAGVASDAAAGDGVQAASHCSGGDRESGGERDGRVCGQTSVRAEAVDVASAPTAASEGADGDASCHAKRRRLSRADTCGDTGADAGSGCTIGGLDGTPVAAAVGTAVAAEPATEEPMVPAVLGCDDGPPPPPPSAATATAAPGPAASIAGPAPPSASASGGGRGAIVYGGVRDGRPVGASGMYLHDELLTGTPRLLTSVIVAGGGGIALQELQYADSRGVPWTYVPCKARHKQHYACEYGPVHEWALARLGAKGGHGRGQDQEGSPPTAAGEAIGEASARGVSATAAVPMAAEAGGLQ